MQCRYKIKEGVVSWSVAVFCAQETCQQTIIIFYM